MLGDVGRLHRQERARADVQRDLDPVQLREQGLVEVQPGRRSRYGTFVARVDGLVAGRIVGARAFGALDVRRQRQLAGVVARGERVALHDLEAARPGVDGIGPHQTQQESRRGQHVAGPQLACAQDPRPHLVSALCGRAQPRARSGDRRRACRGSAPERPATSSRRRGHPRGAARADRRSSRRAARRRRAAGHRGAAAAATGRCARAAARSRTHRAPSRSTTFPPAARAWQAAAACGASG